MKDDIKKRLPKRIERLLEVSYNLWWSWHPHACQLFKSIDRSLWRRTSHNPVGLLAKCRKEDLEVAAKDPAFLQHYDGVIAEYDEYMGEKSSWFATTHAGLAGPIAYFSAEFGVHNSLPIYSGGLGILAGDHCKSASDLGVPLIGVGFMYPQGYVQQRIGIEGWQQNFYEMLDWDNSPVRPARLNDGSECVLRLSVGSWPLYVKVFQVQVGRVRLYLMDTNVDGNDPRDREIAGRLYGGDREARLRQEIVLGIGGVRILKALGIEPKVYHANEGHASFLMLERIRALVEKGKPFDEARCEVAESTVFTTHTPVPAGHDVFEEKMIEDYFGKYWPELGLEKERFLALARVPGQNKWNMTALALRLAGRVNGVSKRNGDVSRKMWTPLFPDVPAAEIPITSVTNGIHMPTWLAQSLADAYSTHVDKNWRTKQADAALWENVDEIPDKKLWGLHQRAKRDLITFVRRQIRKRWMADRVDPSQVLAGGALLDPETLTIGFARRFASYKRATLIFRDLERLKKIMLDPWQPVQLVFAGKAHPADDGGKALIQRIYRLSKDPAVGGHVAFIEDYDMHKAHYLVQGVDVWLNNPLAPLEACGTSGQKAAVNGVPNLSILDGWWEEGYNRGNGWAPKETSHLCDAERNKADAENIYKLLEEQVVPLFYDRNANNVPTGWVRVMKSSIKSVAPEFCADRMVKEYVERMYFPQKAKVREKAAA